MTFAVNINISRSISVADGCDANLDKFYNFLCNDVEGKCTILKEVKL